MTVAENVLMGREPARWGVVDPEAAYARTAELLSNFPHPELRPHRSVGELPLAAQQVVEICRALASDCRILLMDEPTSSLQRADVDRLFALIRRLRTQGLGIVYISHFLEEVRRDRRRVHRAARRPQRGPRADSRRHQRAARRAHGRPAGREPVPAPRRQDAGEVVLVRAGARGAPRRALGELRAAPRRGARDRRPDGLGPHRDGAGHLRSRSDRSVARSV